MCFNTEIYTYTHYIYMQKHMFTTFVLHHYCPLGSPGGPAQRAPCGIVGLGIQPNDANLTATERSPATR